MTLLRKKLYEKQLKNLKIYREFQEVGFDYILNPVTQELHLVGLNNFLGSHNLILSNLEDFIGLVNVGVAEVHKLPNGVPIPIYDLETDDLIDEYTINKCLHCFS